MKKAIISIAIIVILIATALPLAMASADDEPSLDHVALAPTEVTLPVGSTQQFTAAGQDSENNTIADVNYTWGVVIGSGNVTELGLFKTGTTAGTSIVQVIAEKGGIVKTAQATVTVVVPSILDHVVISPETATIPINGTQQFTAAGQNSANVTVEDVNFTWAVITGSGNVTQSGLFTAFSTAGTSVVQVLGEKDGIIKTAQATITIVVPSALDHVVISPKHAEIEINETQQFTAVGYDSANNPVAGVNYTWGVISGSGNITASGLFTAGSTAGTSVIQVIATKNGITKTAVATVKVSSPSENNEEERQTPPGWEHGKKKGWGGEDTPPGWQKGNKKGWGDDNCPPGLKNKENKHGHDSDNEQGEDSDDD